MKYNALQNNELFVIQLEVELQFPIKEILCWLEDKMLGHFLNVLRDKKLLKWVNRRKKKKCGGVQWWGYKFTINI